MRNDVPCEDELFFGLTSHQALPSGLKGDSRVNQSHVSGAVPYNGGSKTERTVIRFQMGYPMT